MIRLEFAFLLFAAGALVTPFARAASPGAGGLTPPVSDGEAWALLPKAAAGSGRPLPSWARMMARSLPRTTAALLELDLAQRTRSPLDPKLRAAMRWVAARENGCAYGETYAAADARRAGTGVDTLTALAEGDVSAFSADEKAALAFARKMTVESSKVTDDEFAALVNGFGEKKVAAMVLLLAYANFQDRLLTVLGAKVEDGGPLPPVDVAFKLESLTTHKAPAAPPSVPDLPKPAGRDLVEDEAGWSSVTYDQLQAKLERQRGRATRLRVPTFDEVMKGLPPGATMQGKRVVWSLVAFGYCPELAAPWEAVMWANGGENGRRFDRAFGLGLFWVVTRTIDCPYCMGHVEMNWEVIGMTPRQIAERSCALAGDDWSSFPASEQRAFALARKLTAAPSAVGRSEIEAVVEDYGLDPALSLLTYACRCNYMVRVSNGFQLSLERDNVFFDYYNTTPPSAAPAGSGPRR